MLKQMSSLVLLTKNQIQVTPVKAPIPAAIQKDSSIPLAKELSSLLTQSNRSQQDGLSDTFTKEISLFMTGGAEKKTQALKELSRSLLTVPPTSVEAERTFSASGLFLTKLRCRLSDASLDMLIFLKFYFSCTKS